MNAGSYIVTLRQINVVMIEGVPKLIDFGIAFAINEDRLTPIDDATANRYSPDPALNYMEEVPPWLDVYMLAQLLIWMVSEAHAKPRIHRPLDWRFVRYPFSSKESLNKVRAITASCSDEGVGPKNAGDLKRLIGELFENRMATGGMVDLDRIEKIFGMISNGKASNIGKFVSARSSIAARLPLFESLCGDFERELRGMLEELRKDLPLTITKFESVQEFIRSFQQTSQDALPPVLQSITIEVKYGEKDNLAAFGCCYLLYTAKQIENQPDFKAIEGHPILCFTVNGSNEKLQRSGKTKSYYVIPTNAGTVNLLDANLRVIEETDILGVISAIKEAIIDPEVWEIMYQ